MARADHQWRSRDISNSGYTHMGNCFAGNAYTVPDVCHSCGVCLKIFLREREQRLRIVSL